MGSNQDDGHLQEENGQPGHIYNHLDNAPQLHSDSELHWIGLATLKPLKSALTSRVAFMRGSTVVMNDADSYQSYNRQYHYSSARWELDVNFILHTNCGACLSYPSLITAYT